MPVLQTILVDLDGTLLNHDRAARLAAIDLARDSGLDHAEPDKLWAELSQQWWAAFQRGECSFTDQRRQRIWEFLPQYQDCTIAEVDQIFRHYCDYYEHHWQTYVDAEGFIKRALDAGLKVGILTNGDADQQRKKLQRIGISRPEVALFASTSSGFWKPDPRSYLSACAALAAEPATTLMVGDDLINDCTAAREAGLFGVHLSRDSTSPDPSSVTSLDQITF